MEENNRIFWDAGYDDAISGKENSSCLYKGIEKEYYNAGFLRGQLARITTTRIHIRR